MRFHPTKGVHKMHTGIDLPAQMGDPVQAVCAGIVYMASWNGDYGITVKVLGQDQLLHMYCHLSSVSVAENQQVSAGETIGNAGRTGESTGVHLHYEVRRSPYNYGDDINPIPILQQATLY
jgi:murein DD-endopeptidase MepM/ murein hydrolase activator NlpD